MKIKQVLAVKITSLLLLYGCSNNQDSVEESGLSSKDSSISKSAPESKGSSVINQEYPDAQAEVLATFVDIATNITLGAGQGADSGYMDQLISFHDYSNIFTEFNYDFNGFGYLTDDVGNEEHERMLFGEIVALDGVKKFSAVPGTLKIAVYYGNVANLTFISDFELMIGDNLHTVNNLITLLFIKTKGEWKMVHEHHSPSKILPSTGDNPIHILSEFDPSSASAAQLEVYATFGAIGATIMANSGTGAENMDELISFHAYGPKFTEFNYDAEGNGFLTDSEGNEEHERALFGNYTVEKFAYKENTLNIAVYHRNVANVTFISDFEVAGIGTINNLITLLFVKTKGEWKMVHEHHSPENH
jgi:hypothetical protein